jgi:hypothetical protein
MSTTEQQLGGFDMDNILPRRYGPVTHAVARSGRSRSTLYLWAAAHPGLFRKDGRATIVDYTMLDAISDSLPIAKIKPVVPARHKEGRSL